MESQLKFVAALFKMAMKEFDRVMGPESIQTIFRLIGENQGESIESRMKKKYNVDKWTPENFAENLVKDVLEPVLGKGKVKYEIKGDELIFDIGVCPFRRAGINISSQVFCNYTEGLIETSAKKALTENIEFNPQHSIAKGDSSCLFKLKIKK